jgi:hypothetical protein
LKWRRHPSGTGFRRVAEKNWKEGDGKQGEICLDDSNNRPLALPMGLFEKRMRR